MIQVTGHQRWWEVYYPEYDIRSANEINRNTARRHVPVDNVGLFWLAMVIIWVIGMGVLYLAPRLT